MDICEQLRTVSECRGAARANNFTCVLGLVNHVLGGASAKQTPRDAEFVPEGPSSYGTPCQHCYTRGTAARSKARDSRLLNVVTSRFSSRGRRSTPIEHRYGSEAQPTKPQTQPITREHRHVATRARCQWQHAVFSRNRARTSDDEVTLERVKGKFPGDGRASIVGSGSGGSKLHGTRGRECFQLASRGRIWYSGGC